MKQLISKLPKLPRLPGMPKVPGSSRGDHASLRTIRLRARWPRYLLWALVLILCVAGVRNIFGSRATAAPVAVKAAASGSQYDVGAAAFAQSFTSTYLTWGATGTEHEREQALKPFLAENLSADGGLTPASGTTEAVSETEVEEVSEAGELTDVLVVARTSNGTKYLSVPVARDEDGLLSIASYPALVGPPATDTSAAQSLQSVEDKQLETVVSRGLRNYLEGEAANLRADLTSDAVVSLPPTRLQLTQIVSVDWLVPNRTVSIEVEVTDREGAEMTLTYQVGVERLDRWYIGSIQFDPTLKGGK